MFPSLADILQMISIAGQYGKRCNVECWKSVGLYRTGYYWRKEGKVEFVNVRTVISYCGGRGAQT